MLSEHLRRLLNDFDKAAQSIGWECDQGSEKRAAEAWQEYLDTKDRLIKHLEKVTYNIT